MTPPTSWITLFSFVYLLAPGLLFTLLARRRRIAAPRSGFLETSDIIFFSMIFTGIGFIVVSIIGHFKPTWIFDPQKYFSSTHTVLVHDYWLILKTLVLAEIVAFGAVGIQHLYLASKIGKGWRMQEVSPWQEAFAKQLKKDFMAYATICDTNGTKWAGYILSYTPDAEMTEREIVLVRPRSPDGNDPPHYPTEESESEFIILASPEIKNIVVRLVKIEKATENDVKKDPSLGGP